MGYIFVIEIKKDKVHRSAGNWTPRTHQFLNFLHANHFTCVSRPLGFDESGREVLSFMNGKTYDDPLPAIARSKETLISVAHLLRQYHELSQKFLLENLEAKDGWMFKSKEPQEVICHGDFAPYNICFENGKAIGMIDFDTAHPGPRVWDIVYALYRFCPFYSPEDPHDFGNLEDKISRAQLFCEAYGLSEQAKLGLLDLMIERLEDLVNFLLASAKSGDQKYVINLQEEHHLKYLADIEYLKSIKSTIDRL